MYHDQVIDDYEKQLAEKYEHIDALAAEVAELQAKLDRVEAYAAELRQHAKRDHTAGFVAWKLHTILDPEDLTDADVTEPGEGEA
ncbi:MAG: hypothetical protein J2P24_00235 [Streptosporangiales bacterium]|nr:hypothetical protein [Streptosporangiales bacterium]